MISQFPNYLCTLQRAYVLPNVYETLFLLYYGITLWSVGCFHFIVFPVYWWSIHSFMHVFIHPGIMNLPAVALGIITGGFVLKRFKLGVIGAARVSIAASFGASCLLFIQIFLHCDTAEVAGLTVSYQGWVACNCRFKLYKLVELVKGWFHCKVSYHSVFDFSFCCLNYIFPPKCWVHNMHNMRNTQMLNRPIGQRLHLKGFWLHYELRMISMETDSSFGTVYPYSISVHVCVHQGSSSVLQPTDLAVTVQHGLLLLNEALGPSMRPQRSNVCLTLPGWLPDLHRHWQGNGKTVTFP